MIDVIEHIAAAHRRVAALHDDRGEVRSVIISRRYSASVSEVWDACTNPERIVRWFLPIAGDLRTGGRYQLEGNAGGMIDRCDPPTRLSATWEFSGEVSWIELLLTPEIGEVTLFELTHTVPVDKKWQEFGPGSVGPGWDLALVGLAAHLASADGGRGISPTWTEENEGIQSIRMSSERWYQANLEAGSDPDNARAAAERTAAFWCAPSPTSVTHVGKQAD